MKDGSYLLVCYRSKLANSRDDLDLAVAPLFLGFSELLSLWLYSLLGLWKLFRGIDDAQSYATESR